MHEQEEEGISDESDVYSLSPMSNLIYAPNLFIDLFIYFKQINQSLWCPSFAACMVAGLLDFHENPTSQEQDDHSSTFYQTVAVGFRDIRCENESDPTNVDVRSLLETTLPPM